jgi:hypothetical protein
MGGRGSVGGMGGMGDIGGMGRIGSTGSMASRRACHMGPGADKYIDYLRIDTLC